MIGNIYVNSMLLRTFNAHIYLLLTNLMQQHLMCTVINLFVYFRQSNLFIFTVPYIIQISIKLKTLLCILTRKPFQESFLSFYAITTLCYESNRSS